MKTNTTVFLVCVLAILHNASTYCIEEPNLCRQCGYSAKCVTNDSSTVVPQKLAKYTRSLDIFYNGQDAAIPANSFANYPNLVNLNIRGLHINSIANGTFASLLKLERLVIYSTRISVIPDKLFAVNSSIKYLSIDHNKITKMPYHLFRDLPNLERLSVSFNGYVFLRDCKSIGSEFDSLSKLTHLTLAKVSIPDCGTNITRHLFKPVQHQLKALNLTWSNITGISPYIFRDFTSLESLDISLASQFRFCPAQAKETFENLPDSLQILTLRRWRVDVAKVKPDCIMTDDTLAGLKNMSNLVMIDMKYGDLMFGSILKKSLFSGFKHLRNLQVSWCRFVTIEDRAFDECPKLTTLSLDGNPVGSRPFKLYNSSDQSKLTTLKMTRASVYSDYIKDYNFHEILQYVPLKVINLRHNYLHVMPVFTINKTYPSVEAIYLDDNYIVNIASYRHSSFGDQCRYFPNLVELTMNNNDLTEIADLCPLIEVLILSENYLDVYWDENQKVISRLKHLKKLDLSGNALKRISKDLFSAMRNLTEVSLADNNITHLDVHAFRQNILLEVIDIQDNDFTKFSSAFIKHLTRLRILRLDNNLITLLDENLINYLTDSESFQLLGVLGNSLQCECDQEFFQKFMRESHKVSDSSVLKCSGAISRGERIYEYKRNKYNCDIKGTLEVALIVVGSIVGALLVSLPCYRYRWYVTHLRVVLRAVGSQISAVRFENKCQYDAYVLYNSASDADLNWIKQSMLPAIEKDAADFSEDSLKLYVVDRDSLLGSSKHTTMLSAMEKSRKVIVVLSNSCLDNAEFKGQTDLAGREAYGQEFYQPDKILVLVREKLNEDIIQTPFTSLLTETVIEVPDSNEKALTRMWQRVKRYISKPRYDFVRKPSTDSDQPVDRSTVYQPSTDNNESAFTLGEIHG